MTLIEKFFKFKFKNKNGRLIEATSLNNLVKPCTFF